jgi:hypothetical protein
MRRLHWYGEMRIRLLTGASAAIGIVMGLGAAGVLNWYTAVAFSLGADLGTIITSWMASLNLSENAKRAAYAHISFNFIGVALMLPLFSCLWSCCKAKDVLRRQVFGLENWGHPGAWSHHTASLYILPAMMTRLIPLAPRRGGGNRTRRFREPAL